MDIGARTVPWRIEKGTVRAVPSQTGEVFASGSAVSPQWDGYDPAFLAIGGTWQATTAGTYTATFTPTDNCAWEDGTTGPKSATWVLKQKLVTLTVPTMTRSSFSHNGLWQNPTMVPTSTLERCKVSGDYVMKNQGSYSFGLTPKAGYCWSDGTTRTMYYSWRIS